MPSGFKIASAYVDVTLNREALPGDLEALARQLSTSTDAIGEDAGKRIGDGIGRGLGDAPVTEPATRKGTEAGGRFGDAFSSRMKAALSSLPPVGVPVDDSAARIKLDFIRQDLQSLSKQKIGVDVSETDALAKLSYLRAQMDDLRTMSASVQVRADTTAASVEIDRFLALTEAKAEVAGRTAGDRLSSGMAAGAESGSPLIVAAITGALMAGGPAVSAAGILLFGGLAAVAASNVGSVQDSFHALGAHVMNDVQSIAEQSAGEFNAMASDIQTGFDRVEPSVRAALIGVAPEIHDVADAFVSAGQTAVPAFTRAIQQGQPVVQGLDALVRDLGTGLAGLLDKLTAHSGAEGQVLSQLGQAVDTILPIIGTFLGEGAELASHVLPLITGGLSLFSGALNAVAPALPAVTAGIAGFKIGDMAAGWLGNAAGAVGNLGDKMGGGTENGGVFSDMLSAVGDHAEDISEKAGPMLGAAISGVSIVMERSAEQADQWAQAIASGGAAAEQAQRQMSNWGEANKAANSGFGGFIANLIGSNATIYNTANAIKQAKGETKDLTDNLSPLERAQQDVTKATNDYSFAVDKYGVNSGQAAGAAVALADANDHLAGMQGQIKAATEGASSAQEANAATLQGITDKASAASTQISLLKGALDALTGKTITADQAEIAVTQSVDAVTQAIKGKTAALGFTNGQLDLHNTKSAQAAQLLISLASTQHQEIATLEQQGTSTADVTAKAEQQRQQFIQVAQQLGATAQQAQTLADRYYGIPSQVATNIQAYDNASPTIQRVQNLMAGLHNKDIYITTYSRVVSSGPAGLGGAATPNATGGVMLPMAAGGIVAMAAGADIFEPNNPTVLIGDNRRVRESFIPQDDSARSKSILAETAGAMGYGLVPGVMSGASGGATAPVTINVDSIQISGTYDLASSSDLRRAATVLRDELVKIERSFR